MEIKEQNLIKDNASDDSGALKTFPGELYVKNVHKSFGVTKALANVSFTGYFGEIHAIIGGNGFGKSTLAKVLAGVLPIDSGKVSIKGAHPSTPKESRNLGVAMVFQEVLVATRQVFELAGFVCLDSAAVGGELRIFGGCRIGL